MASFTDVKVASECLGYEYEGLSVAVDAKNEPLFNVWQNDHHSRFNPDHYDVVHTYRHTHDRCEDGVKCDICDCVQQEDKFAILKVAIWQTASTSGPKAVYRLCPFCIGKHKMTPHLPDNRVYFACIPSCERGNGSSEVHFIKSKSWLEFTKQTIHIERKSHVHWIDCRATSLSVDDPDSKLDARAVFDKHKGETIRTFSLPDFYRVFSAPQKFDQPVYLASASFEAVMCEKITENKIQAQAAQFASKIRKRILPATPTEIYGSARVSTSGPSSAASPAASSVVSASSASALASSAAATRGRSRSRSPGGRKKCKSRSRSRSLESEK